MRTIATEGKGGPIVRGRLRRRLLLNAVVDPAEAAERLPDGLRPHVTALGTVVGCCLLEIDDLRPGRLPARAGIRMRAAAHRISAEWDDERGERVVGVFVPERLTDSRLAVLLGGRWLPGVHHRAEVGVRATSGGLSWRVEDGGAFDIAAAVSISSSLPASHPGPMVSETIGGTCLAATIGVSPDRRGRLEGARMEPEHRHGHEVVVDELRSGFIDSFRTAEPAPAYLMQHVPVTWTRAAPPQLAPAAQVQADEQLDVHVQVRA